MAQKMGLAGGLAAVLALVVGCGDASEPAPPAPTTPAAEITTAQAPEAEQTMVEPTAEATVEATAEPTVEPTAEPPPEPTTPEPTADRTPDIDPDGDLVDRSFLPETIGEWILDDYVGHYGAMLKDRWSSPARAETLREIPRPATPTP